MNILNDLDKLSLTDFAVLGILMGATVRGTNKYALPLIMVLRAIGDGLIWGAFGAVIVYGGIDQAGFIPHKWLFGGFCFLSAYLGHVWRSVADQMGKELNKSKAKIAKQVLKYLFKPITDYINKP